MNQEIDFRALFDALPSPYMILDRDLRFVTANAEYCRTTGRSCDELVGQHVFEMFPESEEREKLFGDAFRAALAGDCVVMQREKFDIPGDGGTTNEVYWNCHQIPVRNTSGDVIGVLQKAVDVSAAVRSEQMRETTMRELDHRVKNVISKVQAIAHRTAMGENSLDSFLERFNARMIAMAKLQTLLVAGVGQGVSLRSILELELEPYDGTASILGGEELSASGSDALTLGLAFHELATNAAKYGAFAHPAASLAVRWSVDGGSVTIDWIEQGVPVVRSDKQGFGSTILRRIVPKELGGSVDWTLTDDGLHCRITLPRDRFDEA